ncbi:hypothetical protein [Haloactinopolyspora sp.]|nr:hypothetical protein [Haloactinopolyspora sp.]
MSETSRLQIVTGPVSGWCDPVTGVCHIETDDEVATEPDDTAGTEPDAAS